MTSNVKSQSFPIFNPKEYVRTEVIRDGLIFMLVGDFDDWLNSVKHPNFLQTHLSKKQIKFCSQVIWKFRRAQ